MAYIKLGDLTLPGNNDRPPVVQRQTIFPGTALDTFEFLTPGGNINLSVTGISGGGNVNLNLFHDANGNDVLDPGDKFLGSSQRANQLDESVNINGAVLRGKFFAQVEKQVVFGVGDIPVSYTFAASRALLSNLLPKESELGTLAQDVTRKGEVGNLNTTDVYSFSLKRGDLVRIRLSEQGGDARMRLFQDRNGNKLIDAGERVTSGTSNQLVIRGRFNSPTTDYLLQVNQVSGATQYEVSFDRLPFAPV